MFVKELLNYVKVNDLQDSEIAVSLAIKQHGVLGCEESLEYVHLTDIELLQDGRLILCLGPVSNL